jgi:hypothetical protein
MFSKKILTVVIAGIIGISSFAELVKKTDGNTLWVENGKDIKTSVKNAAGAWRTSRFTITPAKEKGFNFISKNKKVTTGRYMTVSPEYPWFCWKITRVKKLKGYRALSMGNFVELGCNQVGEVSNLLEGYYAINIAQNSKLTKKGTRFLRVDQHGFETTFEYMKMV